MKLSNLLYSVALLGMLFFGSIGKVVALDEPISVTLQPTGLDSDYGKPKVVVTITNNSDAPVTLSKYQLPFGWEGRGIPTEQFVVRVVTAGGGGGQVPRKGNYENSIKSDPAAYIQLAPHASLSGTVDLRETYDWQSTGLVENRVTVKFFLILGMGPADLAPDPNAPDQPNQVRTIESNQITIDWNTNAGANVIDTPSPDESALSPNTSISLDANIANTEYSYPWPADSTINDPRKTCSKQKADVVLAALYEAYTLAGSSLKYLRAAYADGAGHGGFDSTKPAAKTYIDYFGEFIGNGTSDFPTDSTMTGSIGDVVGRYMAIQALALPNETSHIPVVTTECGCGSAYKDHPETIAVSRPYLQILICDSFFSLPFRREFDSQALTMLHELTHHRVYIAHRNIEPAGDYRYTSVADKAFARTNGFEVILNADSYERVSVIAARYNKLEGW